MLKTVKQLEPQMLTDSNPQMLKLAWQYFLCAVIGTGLLTGLLVILLISLPIFLFKLNQRGMSVRFVIGLLVYLGAITVWMLGRFLFTRVTRLLKTAKSPELSPLLTYASATFAVVCL